MLTLIGPATRDGYGTRWEQEAHDVGAEHARNVATWTTDGNTDPAGARRVLEMLNDGDPAAWDHLPPAPDLSGQWADALTPRGLFEQVTGCDAHLEASWDADAYNAVVDALCDAFETGVSTTFENACELELSRFTTH